MFMLIRQTPTCSVPHFFLFCRIVNIEIITNTIETFLFQRFTLQSHQRSAVKRVQRPDSATLNLPQREPNYDD